MSTRCLPPWATKIQACTTFFGYQEVKLWYRDDRSAVFFLSNLTLMALLKQVNQHQFQKLYHLHPQHTCCCGCGCVVSYCPIEWLDADHFKFKLHYLRVLVGNARENKLRSLAFTKWVFFFNEVSLFGFSELKNKWWLASGGLCLYSRRWAWRPQTKPPVGHQQLPFWFHSVIWSYIRNRFKFLQVSPAKKKNIPQGLCPCSPEDFTYSIS